jgi:uncharacterized membrane protein YtjA (UPF0391 family)
MVSSPRIMQRQSWNAAVASRRPLSMVIPVRARASPRFHRSNSTPELPRLAARFATENPAVPWAWRTQNWNGDWIMGNLLHYALVFLVVALVAAAVGFGGVAGLAMEGARLLFWVFIILFVVSLVAGLVRRS